MPLTAEERYERLQQTLEKTKKRLEKLDAARNDKTRKRDLKMKIIFGAAVIDQAKTKADTKVFLRSVGERLTRQSDKDAFDSWLKDNAWLLENEPK
jgi:hypothetical protein